MPQYYKKFTLSTIYALASGLSLFILFVNWYMGQHGLDVISITYSLVFILCLLAFKNEIKDIIHNKKDLCHNNHMNFNNKEFLDSSFSDNELTLTHIFKKNN